MESIKVYAGYNINMDERLNSSSGAVFSLLAKYVLSKQGIIYGVKMSNDCYSAEFARITNENELDQLRGSKYLQAKVGNTYKQVRNDLLYGKNVLFSGTGCQVNGLKSFLGKEYDNLFCVDVICHGVPSPALWRKYVEHKEKEQGSKLTRVNFRCKDDSWKNFGMREIGDNQKEVYISKDKDTFMQMFLRNYCLRPSCYECKARKVRCSDITIADFWGIENVASEMNDGNGISLIIVRTKKGLSIFNQIKNNMVVKEVSYEEGVRENSAEYKSPARPPQRDTFFLDMETLSFLNMEKKYAAPRSIPLYAKVKRKIKGLIKTIILMFHAQKLIGGGTKKSNDTYGLLFTFDKCE